MIRQKAVGFCTVYQETGTPESFEATGLGEAVIREKEQCNGKLEGGPDEEELPFRLPQEDIPFFCT